MPDVILSSAYNTKPDGKSDVKEEILDTFSRVMLKEISSHTVPLLESLAGGGIQLRGTGVFVKLFQSYYIFTASHVVDDREILSVSTVCGIIKLAGIAHLSQEKIVDAAFIYIPQWLGDLLCYTHNPVNDTHIITNMPDLPRYPYITYGYPEVNFKKDRTGVISGFGSGWMLFISRQKVYKAFKRDPGVNYIFDLWQAQRLDGSKVKIKPLNGMSGGGIWLIGYDKIGGRIRTWYNLVGIINECQKKPFYVFVGTKIYRYMTEIINEYSPKNWYMKKNEIE